MTKEKQHAFNRAAFSSAVEDGEPLICFKCGLIGYLKHGRDSNGEDIDILVGINPVCAETIRHGE